MLQKVRRGDFLRPRQHDSSIDPCLESVCLKAMASAPEDRYGSCRALADDIERWAADEPVTAWREPFSRRARRWGRRHRTAVTGAAVALVAGIVGLSAVLAVQTRSNSDLRAANEEVRKSVDRMLTEVGAVEMADVPQMEQVRERLLRSALEFYVNYLGRKGSDSRFRGDRAAVQINLAQVQDLLGAGTSAETSYRQAITLLKAGGAEARDDLARAWDGLGMVLKQFNRFREAEQALREGLRFRTELAAQRPTDTAIRGALAQSRYHLGAVLARVPGRGPEDERLYHEAIDGQKRLLAENREHPDLEQRGRLARSLNNMGLMLREGGRIDEAEGALEEAKSLLDNLVAAAPNSPGHRWQRSRAMGNLGVLRQAQGRTGTAEKLLDEARKELLPLTVDYPSIPDYRRDLASVFNNLGRLYLVTNRPEAAEKSYRDAIERQERLAEDFPLMPGDRYRLASTRLNLGLLQSKANPSAAEPVCRETVDEFRRIVDAYPGVSEYRQALGRALFGLASCLIRLRSCGEAVSHLNEAIALHRGTLASPPDQAGLALLRDDNLALAMALVATGDHAGAAEAAEQLPELEPGSAAEYIDAAGFLVQCSDLARRDQGRTDPKQAEAAEDYALRAVSWLRRAIEKGLIAAPSALEAAGLRPLHGRPDFEELRARLRGQAAPRCG